MTNPSLLEPPGLVHLLVGVDQGGTKYRQSNAKCGVVVRHAKNEPCLDVVAWWNDVTCPACKQAGAGNVDPPTQGQSDA